MSYEEGYRMDLVNESVLIRLVGRAKCKLVMLFSRLSKGCRVS